MRTKTFHLNTGAVAVAAIACIASAENNLLTRQLIETFKKGKFNISARPGNVPVRFVYHKYDADSDPADFGQEFDAIASGKFGKNWTVLFEYAFHDARRESRPSQAVPSMGKNSGRRSSSISNLA